MEKTDIKWPMWGKFRNGKTWCTVKDPTNTYLIVEDDGHTYISDYWNNDLTYGLDNSAYDIVEVYGKCVEIERQFFYGVETFDTKRKWDLDELVWKRKEEKPICTIDGVDYSESTLRSLIKKATNGD